MDAKDQNGNSAHSIILLETTTVLETNLQESYDDLKLERFEDEAAVRCKAMLAQGANVNYVDEFGLNPIQLARGFRFENILSILTQTIFINQNSAVLDDIM